MDSTTVAKMTEYTGWILVQLSRMASDATTAEGYDQARSTALSHARGLIRALEADGAAPAAGLAERLPPLPPLPHWPV